MQTFNFLRTIIEQKYSELKSKIEKSFRSNNQYLNGFINIKERIHDLQYIQPKIDTDFLKRK